MSWPALRLSATVTCFCLVSTGAGRRVARRMDDGADAPAKCTPPRGGSHAEGGRDADFVRKQLHPDVTPTSLISACRCCVFLSTLSPVLLHRSEWFFSGLVLTLSCASPQRSPHPVQRPTMTEPADDSGSEGPLNRWSERRRVWVRVRPGHRHRLLFLWSVRCSEPALWVATTRVRTASRRTPNGPQRARGHCETQGRDDESGVALTAWPSEHTTRADLIERAAAASGSDTALDPSSGDTQGENTQEQGKGGKATTHTRRESGEAKATNSPDSTVRALRKRLRKALDHGITADCVALGKEEPCSQSNPIMWPR